MFPASSNNPMTSEPVSDSESTITSETDKEGIANASISKPLQVKCSDSKVRKSFLLGPTKDPTDANLNLVQRTLQSMASRVVGGHVLSLEKQRHRKLDGTYPVKTKPPSASDDSLSRNDLSGGSNTTEPLAHPPNPFVSNIFRLSFELTPWRDLYNPAHNESYLMTKVRHGPYPVLHVWLLEHGIYPLRSIAHIEKRRIMRERQRQQRIPTPPPLPPLFKAKIPWRGKNILVKLPPGTSASASIERKNEPYDDVKAVTGVLDEKK